MSNFREPMALAAAARYSANRGAPEDFTGIRKTVGSFTIPLMDVNKIYFTILNITSRFSGYRPFWPGIRPIISVSTPVSTSTLYLGRVRGITHYPWFISCPDDGIMEDEQLATGRGEG